jgi:hypothetical protein
MRGGVVEAGPGKGKDGAEKPGSGKGAREQNGRPGDRARPVA